MSIRRNTLWNFLGSAAPMLVGIWAVPILLERLGAEAFGLLTLIWALIGYFSVFDFGIGRALTQQVSACRSGGSSIKMDAIVTTGLLLVTAFGLLGCLVLVIAAHPLAYIWLNLADGLKQTASNCLYVAALGIPLATVMAGQRGILEGLEQFALANLLRVLLGVANFALPVGAVLWLGPSLEDVVATLLFARAAAVGAHWAVLRSQGIWPKSVGPADRRSVNDLMTFGGWMTLSNVVSPLMVTADRFVIASVLGTAVVAYYTVPFDFMIRLLVVPAALTSTLFPRFAVLYRENRAHLHHAYREGLTLMMMAMLPLCAILALGSREGLTLWLGESFAEKSWLILSILAAGLFFNGTAQIPHAAIQAAGNARATALLHVAEFVVYLPALLISLSLFGVIGASVAWVARVLCDLLVLLVVAHRQTS